MGFFDLFKSKEERAKLSHLKSLVAITLADGKIEESELKALAAVCACENINPEELKKIFANPQSVDFVPPTTDEAKIRYMKDMVALMMSDGNINENEMLGCKLAAQAFGYDPAVIDAMILGIIAELKEALDRA